MRDARVILEGAQGDVDISMAPREDGAVLVWFATPDSQSIGVDVDDVLAAIGFLLSSGPPTDAP